MKVLMLGWELPPHNSGGLGVACYQLCKALSKKEVDIEFVVPYTADHNIDFMRVNSAHPQDVERVLKAGIAYDSFKYVGKTGDVKWVDLFGQSAIYETAVERIVAEAEYDIIHAHDWLTFRAALRAKEKMNKPLVLHVHSIESDRAGKEMGGNPMVREIEHMAMMLADKVIAVSGHTKKSIIREYNIPADKIEIVHNSLDIRDLQPLDGDNTYRYLEKMKAQGYRVVVNVGRLTIQKGLPNLLKAAKEVILRAPKTLFLIVGSGEQERELLLLAAQLGISQNVIFTGFLRGKQWRDAFAIGDLFVMPSISEPFGLTPLEAVGYGTPALISKQSGVSEVLTNCLKVDFWDTDEMANQITAVVQNDGLRDALHANSMREYEQLSWNKAADKLVGMYKQHTVAAMS
ncbi:MAG TPA: glycosyltransferase family 4 protein [Candidatus Limnocylindrales bacterium]|nr:glycosyltransferase family 4 protein [Candidatus Limnocylindrales bacterium]